MVDRLSAVNLPDQRSQLRQQGGRIEAGSDDKNHTATAVLSESLKLNAVVRREAMDVGLICYTAGGTIDGRRGDHVLLAPPFIIEDDQIGELVDKLELALDGALRQIAR